ncbi:hypothetical protein M3Y98_00836000 [Aphelenchoides besseyi]|nr:hypothetical protein M3Y98_00836000 [Aphelenchoides besseyi]KAI6195466.1 hypothetical protein M3Y96_01234300 [Aphelenchoides besseyi]
MLKVCRNYAYPSLLCRGVNGRFIQKCQNESTMTDEKFVVKVEDMRRFVIDCMAAVGAKEENGKKVADLLIAADQRGHYSHGLNRLRIYMEDCRSGNCDPNAQPTILRQKGATAWIDGNNGLGAVVGDYCTRIAIELAQQNGVGWVVAKGSNHFGIAGYWPILMKERGYLGIAMTNTSPLVFPTSRFLQVGLIVHFKELLNSLWEPIRLQLLHQQTRMTISLSIWQLQQLRWEKSNWQNEKAKR